MAFRAVAFVLPEGDTDTAGGGGWRTASVGGKPLGGLSPAFQS